MKSLELEELESKFGPEAAAKQEPEFGRGADFW